MNIKDSIVKQGNLLFRYRSYFPLILYVAAVPFVFAKAQTDSCCNYQSVATVLSLFLALAGFFVRAIVVGSTPKGTSGRNTKTQVAETLNMTGIYATVRHPLYLGNYLIWAGIVAFTFSITFFVIFSLLFWIYYERIMAAEEDFLHSKFADDFIAWSAKTPAFWPNFKNYQKSRLSFSFRQVLRREYSGVLATALSYTFIDVLRVYFEQGVILPNRISYYSLGIVLILTLVLRTLKHHTNVLSPRA